MNDPHSRRFCRELIVLKCPPLMVSMKSCMQEVDSQKKPSPGKDDHVIFRSVLGLGNGVLAVREIDSHSNSYSGKHR
jgi:hypothetical protein